MRGRWRGVPLQRRGRGEDGRACGGGMDGAACRVDQRQLIRGGADVEVGADGAAAAAESMGRVAAHEKGPGSTGCPKNESKDCMLF